MSDATPTATVPPKVDPETLVLRVTLRADHEQRRRFAHTDVCGQLYERLSSIVEGP